MKKISASRKMKEKNKYGLKMAVMGGSECVIRKVKYA
jgi:hypothetical protein